MAFKKYFSNIWAIGLLRICSFHTKTDQAPGPQNHTCWWLLLQSTASSPRLKQVKNLEEVGGTRSVIVTLDTAIYTVSHLASSKFRFITSYAFSSPILAIYPIICQASVTVAFFYFCKSAKLLLLLPLVV